MEDLKKALWEALKEPLREILFAIIPILMVYFQSSTWKYAPFVYLALRYADKFRIEWQKINAEKTGTELPKYKGLSGF